jgi:hypothetical protein
VGKISDFLDAERHQNISEKQNVVVGWLVRSFIHTLMKS